MAARTIAYLARRDGDCAADERARVVEEGVGVPAAAENVVSRRDAAARRMRMAPQKVGLLGGFEITKLFPILFATGVVR